MANKFRVVVRHIDSGDRAVSASEQFLVSANVDSNGYPVADAFKSG
jgi:hypothetical protein